jgi:hypothetical protein
LEGSRNILRPNNKAELNRPSGLFVDGAGDIFIADESNWRIREVIAATANIQTAAGDGTLDGSGDPATQAVLYSPSGVFVDSKGNIFIGDSGDNVILKVVAATGIIETVAGNETAGYSGDGGPATQAELNGPSGVFVDSKGDIFIADAGYSLIREVVAATGIIQTVAGNGAFGYSGDGGPATQATLAGPEGVFVDDNGNVFIGDYGNNAIREVVAATGFPKGLLSCC